MREYDAVARIGGDEFANVLERIPDVGAALYAAKRDGKGRYQVFEEIEGPGSNVMPHASLPLDYLDEK